MESHEHWHGHELDLLTAALIGLTVGATATLLLRRGPSGRRPIEAGLSAAGRGMQWAGVTGWNSAKRAGRAAADRTQHEWERGAELIDELPLDDMGERVNDYLEAVKDAITTTVKREVQDLRKSIRRQRRHMGV